MKKVILLGLVVFVFASETAYAQLHHGKSQAPPESGMMHDQMKKKMHGKMHGTTHGDQTGAQGEHGTSVEPKGDQGPSSAAFHAINKKMHEGMNITFTGNVDRDFVNGMIPHHQGAAEMAKVVLAFGSDPEIRKLAEAVIRAQESEIELMRAWLQRNTK